jgi:hypothetical protein
VRCSIGGDKRKRSLLIKTTSIDNDRGFVKGGRWWGMEQELMDNTDDFVWKIEEIEVEV